MTKNTPTPIELKAEKIRRLAQTDLLAFLIYCWWNTSPLRIGRHTRAICSRLTRAVDDYLKGKTTYLVVNVPFRHGKSDIVSRALPAFFLGRCNVAGVQPNVMLASYGSSLTEGFSKDVQGIISQESYGRVFPGVAVGSTGKGEWGIKDSRSTIYAVGLGGALTGKGGNLLILDDYCKNREEAESAPIRQKMWDSFKDDFSTRMNTGGGIVVVCATRWHEDDITGRIFRAMDEIDGYPQFEKMIFPARKEGPDGWDILFPELYDETWYRSARARLGPHSASALLDNDPKNAGERYLRPEWLQTYYGEIDWRRLKINIFIDGAKGKGRRNDWTTILVIGRARGGEYYLLDGVHAKLNLWEKINLLTSENPKIGLVAKWGGPRVVKCTWWEQVGPMSDVESLRIQMTRQMYHFTVRELRHNQNKDFRIKRLAVPGANDQLFVPSQMIRTRVEKGGEGETDRVVSYDLVKELHDEWDAYTGSCEDLEHDDMIDCLADITDEEVMTHFTPPDGGSDGDDGRAPSDNWASQIKRRGLRS